MSRTFYSSDNCLNTNALRELLKNPISSSYSACCTMTFGSSTNIHGHGPSGHVLVLNGFERGDNEDSKIGWRNGCYRDSSLINLGQNQYGGDGSGPKEVHSQG